MYNNYYNNRRKQSIYSNTDQDPNMSMYSQADQDALNGNNNTTDVYNQRRGMNANQYAQAGAAIGYGGLQAYQGYNNPQSTSLQKTRSVQAGVDNAETGVAGAINPALGMAVGAAKKIGSGVQTQVDRTDANGNIINRGDSKAGEVVGGFLDPANSLIGIYTDPNATTGQKIAGALTGGISDMFTNRHRNQVESSAKSNLFAMGGKQPCYVCGGMNMYPNGGFAKGELTGYDEGGIIHAPEMGGYFRKRS